MTLRDGTLSDSPAVDGRLGDSPTVDAPDGFDTPDPDTA
jgi:hypothetical protein